MKINMCRCHEDKRDIIEHSLADGGPPYGVLCLGCGLDTGHCDTRDEAVKTWNEMVKR